MEQTSKKKTSKPYSPEFRERAVRLLMEHRDEYQSEAAALTAISGKLNCSPDSLRVWVRQALRDGGERPGPTAPVPSTPATLQTVLPKSIPRTAISIGILLPVLPMTAIIAAVGREGSSSH